MGAENEREAMVRDCESDAGTLLSASGELWRRVMREPRDWSAVAGIADTMAQRLQSLRLHAALLAQGEP